jgi:hypothetical protein
MRRKSPSRSAHQLLLFPPAGHELRVELAASQQQELIRALAELLLRAAADPSATTAEAEREDR